MVTTRRLPPTQALIAFEAAARHLSFRRSAEELARTHGAVSHHVRSLEDWLGIALFSRVGRRLVLTEQGQKLALGLREALQLIHSRLDEARSTAGRSTLVVSVLPAFAAHWLVPRLAAFADSCPHIDVHVRPSIELSDLSRDGVDVAIRYGKGRYPNVQAQRLGREKVFAVCSPTFIGGRLPASPADLLRYPLIRNVGQPWQAWIRAARLQGNEPTAGPVFNDSGLALDAAKNGLGIALARGTLAHEDLLAGRLVRLFDVEVDDDFSYWLVWRETSPKRELIQSFRDWLMEAFKSGKRRTA